MKLPIGHHGEAAALLAIQPRHLLPRRHEEKISLHGVDPRQVVDGEIAEPRPVAEEGEASVPAPNFRNAVRLPRAEALQPGQGVAVKQPVNGHEFSVDLYPHRGADAGKRQVKAQSRLHFDQRFRGRRSHGAAVSLEAQLLDGCYPGHAERFGQAKQGIRATEDQVMPRRGFRQFLRP